MLIGQHSFLERCTEKVNKAFYVGIKRPVKYWFQRRFRGFDDSETYSLDLTVAEFTVPRLKRFKKLNNSVPISLVVYANDDVDRASEIWDSHIDRMIRSFEIIIEKDCFYVGMSKKEEKELNEGLDLFRKYILDLWW